MDTTVFLDKFCDTTVGLRKIYITESSGAILAESSHQRQMFDEKIVKMVPKYFERLKNSFLGANRDMTIKTDDFIYLIIEKQSFFITFVCSTKANIALIQEFPKDIEDFLKTLHTSLQKYNNKYELLNK